MVKYYMMAINHDNNKNNDNIHNDSMAMTMSEYFKQLDEETKMIKHCELDIKNNKHEYLVKVITFTLKIKINKILKNIVG